MSTTNKPTTSTNAGGNSAKAKTFSWPSLFLGLAIGVGGALALAHEQYSSSKPVITVNGEAITKKDLQDRTDYLFSQKLLQQMIWDRLALQEAKKENVLPTDAEVQDTINDLYRTSPAVISEAKKNDPTLDVFKEQLKANLAIRNLRIKHVTLTDAEAKAFFNAHKSEFTLPQQTKTTLVITNDKIDADSAKRLLVNGISPNTIAGQRGMFVVGVSGQLTGALPASLTNDVMAMKSGDVREFPIGKQFAIVKAQSIAPYGTPAYETIRAKVEMAAKLAKAPTETQELSKLLNSSKITVEVPRYQDAVPTTGNSNQVASAN